MRINVEMMIKGDSMKKKVIVCIILIVCLSGCSLFTSNVKRLNKVSYDSVMCFYAYGRNFNGSTTQYIMAIMNNKESIPVLAIDKANGLTEMYLNHEENKLFIYSDVAYGVNSENEYTVGRSIVTYDLKKNKATYNEQDDKNDDVFCLLTEHGTLEQVYGIKKDRVNAAKLIKSNLVVAYDDNKLQLQKRGEDKIIKDIVLSQYYGIHSIEVDGDKLYVVGHNAEKKIVITLFDSQLNEISSNVIGTYSHMELRVDDGNLLALASITEKKNEKCLIQITANLVPKVVCDNVLTDTLFYLKKTQEYIYYDQNLKKYKVLDKEGVEKSEFSVSIKQDGYNYPYGFLYID